MTDLDGLDRLADRQQGLLSTRQLRDLGLSDAEVRTLIRRGVLVRVRRGVVRLRGAPPSWLQAVHAPVLAVTGSVASHQTAARLWGFPGFESSRAIHLLREGVLGTRAVGVRSHTSLLVPPSHRAVRHGIPVTSVERTLVDVCGSLGSGRLLKVADELKRQHLLDVDRLRSVTRTVPVSGRRAIRPVLRYLSSYEAGDAPGANAAELDILRALRRAGIEPLPVQNLWVVVAGRRFELDFAWPEVRHALEFMGFNPHGNLVSRFHHDAERRRLLQRDGWTLWPITWQTSEQELLDIATAVTRAARAA